MKILELILIKPKRCHIITTEHTDISAKPYRLKRTIEHVMTQSTFFLMQNDNESQVRGTCAEKGKGR